ncbi:methyltransferase [Candidatus Woesearchaeota archaeon]|nr:methyltransferase [Candidatus Woesearchaeota archaeon]
MREAQYWRNFYYECSINVFNIDFRKTKYLIEYGPGVGTITKALLEKLNANAKLICFEPNAKFCAFLNKKIRDSRLIVINDYAENHDFCLKKLNIKKVDYVCSGIPYSLIDRGKKESIIKKTKNSLKKGGKFIIYQQYNWHLRKYLDSYFENISQLFEVRNIPPTLIYVCEKL